MTNFVIRIFALSFMVIASVAHADTKNLAVEKQCFACHAEVIQIGKVPSFKAIAEKYKGQANVEANLAQKIINGGVGHWGLTPMPAAVGDRPDVSQAEAKELANWILTQH